MEGRAAEATLHTFDGAEFVGEQVGIGMAVAGNAGQTIGAEQRHVNRCCGHRQTLVGTDIRGRLGTPDMLLARLQGQGKTGFAIEIHSAADNTARHLPDMLLLAAHKTEIRAAGRQRHAKRLAFADDDIYAIASPLAGRLE